MTNSVYSNIFLYLYDLVKNILTFAENKSIFQASKQLSRTETLFIRSLFVSL